MEKLTVIGGGGKWAGVPLDNDVLNSSQGRDGYHFPLPFWWLLPWETFRLIYFCQYLRQSLDKFKGNRRRISVAPLNLRKSSPPIRLVLTRPLDDKNKSLSPLWHANKRKGSSLGSIKEKILDIQIVTWSIQFNSNFEWSTSAFSTLS